MKKKNKVGAYDIQVLLRKRYEGDAWAYAEEVPDAVGFGKSRTADGIAVAMWKSRGYEVHGIEIKVSRGDLLRELKDPAKTEAVCQHCDRWWLVVAPGICTPDEVPAAWGILEAKEDLSDLVQVRKAPLLREMDKRSATLDRLFAFALIRKFSRASESEIARAKNQGEAEARTRDQARWADLVEREKSLATQTAELKFAERTARQLKDFEARLGIKTGDLFSAYGGVTPEDLKIARSIRQLAVGPSIGHNHRRSSQLMRFAHDLEDMAQRMTDVAESVARLGVDGQDLVDDFTGDRTGAEAP